MKFLEATIWLTQQRHAGHGLTVSFRVMAVRVMKGDVQASSRMTVVVGSRIIGYRVNHQNISACVLLTQTQIRMYLQE